MALQETQWSWGQPQSCITLATAILSTVFQNIKDIASTSITFDLQLNAASKVKITVSILYVA